MQVVAAFERHHIDQVDFIRHVVDRQAAIKQGVSKHAVVAHEIAEVKLSPRGEKTVKNQERSGPSAEFLGGQAGLLAANFAGGRARPTAHD